MRRLGELAGGNEHALVCVMGIKASGEVSHLAHWNRCIQLVAFCLQIEDIQAELVLLDDTIYATVTLPP